MITQGWGQGKILASRPKRPKLWLWCWGHNVAAKVM